jgi:hypothetical protein
MTLYGKRIGNYGYVVHSGFCLVTNSTNKKNDTTNPFKQMVEALCKQKLTVPRTRTYNDKDAAEWRPSPWPAL